MPVPGMIPVESTSQHSLPQQNLSLEGFGGPAMDNKSWRVKGRTLGLSDPHPWVDVHSKVQAAVRDHQQRFRHLNRERQQILAAKGAMQTELLHSGKEAGLNGNDGSQQEKHKKRQALVAALQNADAASQTFLDALRNGVSLEKAKAAAGESFRPAAGVGQAPSKRSYQLVLPFDPTDRGPDALNPSDAHALVEDVPVPGLVGRSELSDTKTPRVHPGRVNAISASRILDGPITQQSQPPLRRKSNLRPDVPDLSRSREANIIPSKAHNAVHDLRDPSMTSNYGNNMPHERRASILAPNDQFLPEGGRGPSHISQRGYAVPVEGRGPSMVAPSGRGQLYDQNRSGMAAQNDGDTAYDHRMMSFLSQQGYNGAIEQRGASMISNNGYNQHSSLKVLPSNYGKGGSDLAAGHPPALSNPVALWDQPSFPPAGGGWSGAAPAPALVYELKGQLAALQQILAAQVAAQPTRRVAPKWTAPLQSDWNGPSGMSLSPTGDLDATPDGLAAELQGDPEMALMHQDYMKNMTLLKYQINQTRGMAELQQLQSQVGATIQNSMKAGMGQLTLQPFQQTNQAETTRPDVALDTKEVQEEGAPNEKWELQSVGDAEIGEAPPGQASVLDGINMVDVLTKGSEQEVHILQVQLSKLGPLDKPGTYRVSVLLYDGFQPVEVAAGQAARLSTRRIPFTPGDGDSAHLRVQEVLQLRGVGLTPSTMLVFEVHLAKTGVAGMPTNEALVAWAVSPVLSGGELLSGNQVVPVYRLPLMITAQRKFSFGVAMLDFSLVRFHGAPGDVPSTSALQATGAGLHSQTTEPEDVPGVPISAWCRVARAVPPSNPFAPGDGFVVMVDGARFLPLNVTVSKVAFCVVSADRQLLAGGSRDEEAVSNPETEAHRPGYGLHKTMCIGGDAFDNATATLLFAVLTIDKHTQDLRTVGYSVLHLFMDPRTTVQPSSKTIKDYVLNAGSFQIPLHIQPPASDVKTTVQCLTNVPRVPCSTLVVRILTPEMAKAQRSSKLPAYEDRVYDTMLAFPTPLERKMYAKCIQRRVLNVREAARFAYTTNPITSVADGDAALATQKVDKSAKQKSGSIFGLFKNSEDKAGKGGLLSRLFRKPTASSGKGTAEDQVPHPGHAPRRDRSVTNNAGGLPNNDAELQDWMFRRLAHAWHRPPPALDYTFANDYHSDLGFFVALDSAMRLARGLPSAALISVTPPGGFYQDHPIVDDVKVTLEYDMESMLASPRWLDGYQHFSGNVYDPALCVIIDVRLAVPSSGTSSPLGWACLPVFETLGPYVSSGYYHLPLFSGVPSRSLMNQMARRGNAEEVLLEHLQQQTLRVVPDMSSVFVRLIDASRVGQMQQPCGLSSPNLKVPSYLSELGANYQATWQKSVKTPTYVSVKPKNVSSEEWVEQINDVIIRMSGLEEADLFEEDEPEAPKQPLSPRRVSQPLQPLGDSPQSKHRFSNGPRASPDLYGDSIRYTDSGSFYTPTHSDSYDRGRRKNGTRTNGGGRDQSLEYDSQGDSYFTPTATPNSYDDRRTGPQGGRDRQGDRYPDSYDSRDDENRRNRGGGRGTRGRYDGRDDDSNNGRGGTVDNRGGRGRDGRGGRYPHNYDSYDSRDENVPRNRGRRGRAGS